ncbi:MAG: hypothetical protein U1C56_01045 [Candidatus Curtissbacteria bacterium]|nr:hypothetical protein [bacterium]MDZ4209746.1 hypothetical protein [Candidatus Curtissbacteria bacterium]
MSVVAIKTQLLASLNAMGTLKGAFAFETGNPLGKYPFATLTLKSGEGEYADIAHNLRKHSFWIRVYQEQSKEGQGVSQAETIAISVLDELIAHLDLNTTLSGTCKYARPAGYDASFSNRELDMRVLEVQIDCFDLVASVS